MYLIADLIRSTTSSFELRAKRDKDAPPSPPRSCGTTLAQGARFAAYNFGSYVSRCAPLTSVTALDPPRRLTTSPSCEVAYPLLAEWHAAHTDASHLGASRRDASHTDAPHADALPTNTPHTADASATANVPAHSTRKPRGKHTRAKRST